jgi:hypothetical protein
MKLLYPEFLYALFFLVIPILIHLFNFRKYKVIRFPQLRFLQEIQQQSSSTSRLKHLLVLLSRILALSALILAFTQPYLPATDSDVQQGKKGVSIYIDNSFSMEAKASGGQLLDVAKNKAISILDAFDASDKFQLLTNDFEGKHQRWMNKEQFIQSLQNVSSSPVYRKLNEVVNRQDELFKQNDFIQKRYIISDLQKVSFNIETLKAESNLNVIPIQAIDLENISIDQLTFTRPYHSQNSGEEISFKATNFAEESKEDVSGQLFLNDQLKSPFSLNVDSKDSTEKTIAFNSIGDGWQRGQVIIKDYPINFDDTIYFSYPLQSAVNVLHLFEENAHPSLAKLFQNDTFVVYKKQNIKQLDLNQLSKQNLIVLESVQQLSSGIQSSLVDFVQNGGSICLFPDAKSDLLNINSFLSQLKADNLQNFQETEISLSNLNEKAQLYEGVFEQKEKRIDLPKVNEYWQMSSNSRLIRENLLGLRNGNAFLNQYKSGEGKTYLFSSPLDEESTNFSKHAIFVPTLYNMALQSIEFSKTNYSTQAKEIVIKNTQSGESPIRLQGNNREFIPPQQSTVNQTTLNLSSLNLPAGHYQVMQNDNFLAYLSLNYSRKESNPEKYNLSELEEIATTKGIQLNYFDETQEALMNRIATLEEGTPLWKYFIIFALIFLGIEIALLRLLK